MSKPTEIRELQSQISHQIEVLQEVLSYLNSSIAKRPEEADATREDGLIVAGVLENYYLDAERWHASLLENRP